MREGYSPPYKLFTDTLSSPQDYVDEDQLPIELGGTCVSCFDYKGKKVTCIHTEMC